MRFKRSEVERLLEGRESMKVLCSCWFQAYSLLFTCTRVTPSVRTQEQPGTQGFRHNSRHNDSALSVHHSGSKIRPGSMSDATRARDQGKKVGERFSIWSSSCRIYLSPSPSLRRNLSPCHCDFRWFGGRLLPSFRPALSLSCRDPGPSCRGERSRSGSICVRLAGRCECRGNGAEFFGKTILLFS